MSKLYSLCESVHATAISPYCIRELTEKGSKLGGGIDTDSLCGRVKKHEGWDSGLPFESLPNLTTAPICKKCRELLEEKMTEKQFREIQERCEKATEGPWEWVFNGVTPGEGYAKLRHVLHDRVEQCIIVTDTSNSAVSYMPMPLHEDAEFISHARTDIPVLLTEIDRLKECLKVETEKHLKKGNVSKHFSNLAESKSKAITEGKVMKGGRNDPPLTPPPPPPVGQGGKK